MLIRHGHVDTLDLHIQTHLLSILMLSYIAHICPRPVQLGTAFPELCPTFH
jgi:hypothetical protein